MIYNYCISRRSLSIYLCVCIFTFVNRLCLFLRPCICTHIYACVFTSTWSAEGWWFVVYSISCIFSALQRRDWWVYCKMLMHVPCTRCVELPWGGANSLPSDDFPFPWVGFVSSQSAVFSSSRTSKALQWSSAAWAPTRESERDQLHVSRSLFVQLIYSDKTPTLKSSIFLIVTLNDSLSSRRFNCFYVACFQGLPPVNRTCFFPPATITWGLVRSQSTFMLPICRAEVWGRTSGSSTVNRETWGKDVLRIQWWVWEIPEV